MLVRKFLLFFITKFISLCTCNADEYNVTSTYWRSSSGTFNPCPDSWLRDWVKGSYNYRHICYKASEDNVERSWDDATNFCHQLDPRATLPIFRDLPEYISYKNVARWYHWSGAAHFVRRNQTVNTFGICDETWLGISYNASTKNYSWIDGSDLAFSFINFDNVVPRETHSFHHLVRSSNKWVQESKTKTTNVTVCQMRFNPNDSITTYVSYYYPKNQKCPQRENWFYANADHWFYGMGDCYYYDKYDRRNWTSALKYCESEYGGTLPTFAGGSGYSEFVELLVKLQLPCDEDIWLNYRGYRYDYFNFTTPDGAERLKSFDFWSPGYPKDSPHESYVFCSMGSLKSLAPNEFDRQLGKNTDDLSVKKNFLCQCKPGSCRTERVGNQFIFSSFLINGTTLKILETVNVSFLAPEPNPVWTADASYPHIRYLLHNNVSTITWYDADRLCRQLDKRSNLPIFRDFSEYISYTNLAISYYTGRADCAHDSFLGISYNTTTKNYSWIDGSEISFSFLESDKVPEVEKCFRHRTIGSTKWLEYRKPRDTEVYLVCQLRLDDNITSTTVSLDYPKNRKCSGGENWFYDASSNICYYYDKEKRNWTSASSYCTTEVGGSLPYFVSENEYHSFLNLLKALHVDCVQRIWIGYRSVFNPVNGSAGAFFKGKSENFESHEEDFVYLYGFQRWLVTTDKTEKYSFLCQCRSGICNPAKSIN